MVRGHAPSEAAMLAPSIPPCPFKKPWPAPVVDVDVIAFAQVLHFGLSIGNRSVHPVVRATVMAEDRGLDSRQRFGVR